MSVPESNSFAVLSEPHVLTEAANRAGNPSGWRDMLGVVASIACAIHCAAMPFVIGFLPAMGLGFLADEAFHKWMAGACFLIGLAAFIPGWKRHGQLLPAGIAAAGLTIITLAAFGLSGECCPACEAAESSDVVAAASESAGCSDPGCDHCATEAGSAIATTTDEGIPACCQEGCADAADGAANGTPAAVAVAAKAPDCCAEGCAHVPSNAAAAVIPSENTPECCKVASSEDAAQPSATVAAADTPACCEDKCADCETQTAARASAARHGVTECSDEQCAHCVADGIASDAATPAVVQAGFFATYAAWWTPLGGLLMVIGHLLNKRLLCSCACCGTDDTCVTESANLSANLTN